MNRALKTTIGLAGLLYLLVMAYFAFKPFRFVPAIRTKAGAPVWDEAEKAVHLRPGCALVDRKGAAELRRTLVPRGTMSLEILLRTDSLEQSGPARIVSFSRDSLYRNFSLCQEGDALVFRLRTSKNDLNGVLRNLIVPDVFDTNRRQHLVVTYDGAKVRLYVDGLPSGVEVALTGGFENWGWDHALTLGDEPVGGRPWQGYVHKVAIYDRPLDQGEVESLFGHAPHAPEPVLAYDFSSLPAPSSANEFPEGLRPLEYHNLFIVHDHAAFNRADCVANIIGFIPLAPLLYFALPRRLRRKGFPVAVVLPVLLGGIISGGIEQIQRHLDGRVPCALDMAYNLFGTLLGALLLWIFVLANRNRIIKKGMP